MKQIIFILSLVMSLSVNGLTFKEAVAPLIEASCMDCHDKDTDTPLNFEKLGHDLTNAATFRQWTKVFDRVLSGEMPPKNKAASR